MENRQLDPSIILDWRSLEGRDKSQKEINDQRLADWRKKYDAAMSLQNWKQYHDQSRQA